MSEVVLSNPAPPTLAVLAPPPSDPGSAKAALARNTITPADSPATSEISPAPSHTPAPPPVGEAQKWTKDICEICWLPVQGKRPNNLKKKQKEQQKQQDTKKKWWTGKKSKPQETEENGEEEYWIELPCKHRFGSSCLKEWRKTEDEAAESRPIGMGQARNQCPTCKKAYLYHTCHRKSRWRVVRGYQAAKRLATLAPPEICVKCELDAIDDTVRLKDPYWDHGFATLFVGLVMWATIPHNQKHGYEPVTRGRQFVLRHLPQRWRGAMERTWHTRITVGTLYNRKEVEVQYTYPRRRRKPTRAERKERKRQERIKRKQRRNLVRKQPPTFRNSEKSPANNSRSMSETGNAAVAPTIAATERRTRMRECGVQEQQRSE